MAPTTSSATKSLWRWAFAIVPVIGLVELVLHVQQTHAAPSADDWKAARAEVAKNVKPDDLVTFAPRWVDPIGRMTFGSDLATVEREAYPDVSRFPRAFEVSIRGEHNPDLEGWKETGHTSFGGVTVTTLENPHPIVLVDDLLRHMGQPGTHVMMVEGGAEHECSYVHTTPASGALGAGPAMPAQRYMCAGGTNVAVTVEADLNYVPHHCIFAPPPGGNTFIRLRFDDLTFGKALHGHHGISVEQERNLRGAPVTIAFRVGDRDLGKLVHRDGDGWKPFELPTDELAGKKATLDVDIGAANGEGRFYCFEADLR